MCRERVESGSIDFLLRTISSNAENPVFMFRKPLLFARKHSHTKLAPCVRQHPGTARVGDSRPAFPQISVLPTTLSRTPATTSPRTSAALALSCRPCTAFEEAPQGLQFSSMFDRRESDWAASVQGCLLGRWVMWTVSLSRPKVS